MKIISIFLVVFINAVAVYAQQDVDIRRLKFFEFPELDILVGDLKEFIYRGDTLVCLNQLGDSVYFNYWITKDSVVIINYYRVYARIVEVYPWFTSLVISLYNPHVVYQMDITMSPVIGFDFERKRAFVRRSDDCVRIVPLVPISNH